MITELSYAEICAIQCWMRVNKKDTVLVKQDGDSGIGTRTIIVDNSMTLLKDVTDYSKW